MRVLVNQQAVFGARTGIGHYVRELLRGLQGLAGADAIDAYPTGLLGRTSRWAARFTRPRDSGIAHGSTQASWLRDCRHKLLAALRPAGQSLFGQLFRWHCRRGRYDLYHEPNFICYPSAAPTVATLHDLSVVLHPEWHPAHRAALFQRHFDRTLHQAVHFFAISQTGRQEIMRTFGVAPERVTCTYMGVRSGLRPLPACDVAPVLQRLGLPPRYLLCVGTIEPRKNVLRLLRLYASLPAALRAAWPLVLAGSWGWNTEDVAEYYQREGRHRGILHFGYVPDRYLPMVYNGARALVFPSFYEGFGLPPVEMLACGGAVLASTAPAVVETVGAKAHLIDPHDDDGWRAALQRVLTDDDWWLGLRQGAVDVARPFTWERCAAQTLQIYRQLTGTAGANLEPPLAA